LKNEKIFPDSHFDPIFSTNAGSIEVQIET